VIAPLLEAGDLAM